MGVIDRAKADWKKFSQEIQLTFDNNVGQTATIMGIGTRHSISFDTDGMPVKSPNNHISFHEDLITEANPLYIIRPNGGEEIRMMGHRVLFADSKGINRTHIIKEVWPDQTVGMIVCILENEELSY